MLFSLVASSTCNASIHLWTYMQRNRYALLLLSYPGHLRSYAFLLNMFYTIAEKCIEPRRRRERERRRIIHSVTWLLELFKWQPSSSSSSPSPFQLIEWWARERARQRDCGSEMHSWKTISHKKLEIKWPQSKEKRIEKEKKLKISKNENERTPIWLQPWLGWLSGQVKLIFA